MRLIIHPGKPLRGEITLPGDKSISHRAALFAALANGKSCIDNFLVAGVTRVMLKTLSQMSVSWTLHGDTLTVNGDGLEGLRAPAVPLDCGNSATTMRLLTGALAAAGLPAMLDGSPGLRRRPMKRLVEPLRSMGVPIHAMANGSPPLRLSFRPSHQPLRGIDYTLPVASAQIKTALLLAALAGDRPTILHEPGPSRDHSERMLARMGAHLICSKSEGQYTVSLIQQRPANLIPLSLSVPGDFSSAAFLIVAALIIPGSHITIRNVGLNPTRTGLLDALAAMGAQVQVTSQEESGGELVGDLMVGYSSLAGIQVEAPLVVRMIDEFPVFAVAAAFARGQTVVSQAEELRHKESDRITILCKELRALGVNVDEAPDGFSIHGGKLLPGGNAHAHGDHRLGMALAVAGLAAGKTVCIAGAEVIAESYPGFVQALGGLGASVKELP